MAVAGVYSAALFVSAALLFLLEPMVGKLVLPLLGSTPEVWSTTVLFFQAALLAGYAYSHLTARLRTRTQAAVQVIALAVAALALPITLRAGIRPPTSSDPVPWLLALLVTTAGLPFFALSANTPMLQRWLADRGSPYFLYAVSNGGSLIGLLAYPLIVERLLSLHEQGVMWAVGYGVAFLLVLGSAAFISGGEAADAGPAPPPASRRRRLRWFALAFVPASLMLGTTSFVTRDLAPIPLLWVIPLAVYLITLIVAFAPGVRAERIAAVTRLLLPPVAIVVAYTLAIGSQKPLALLLPLHLLGLLVAGLMCHARLAADRPDPRQLTSFYLYVAAGGALGGVFNAVIAPLVFPTLIEYPLAIVAACLLLPPPRRKRPALLEFLLDDARPTRWMDFVAPAVVALAVAGALAAVSSSNPLGPRSAVVGVACGLCVNFARRPRRFGLSVGAILLAAALVGSSSAHVIERQRSFYGIYKVVSADGDRLLYDGTTLHGLQRLGTLDLLSYYNRAGPVGQAFAELPRAQTRSVAIIGLGTGTLACYARPGEAFTFFEVDPTVASIARREFTYLRDCPGRHAVVIGDGRLSLARAGRFGLVVIDAFNSDAIPVHLITRQAIELYLRHGAAILYHISNRYLALEPVLGDIARKLRLTCLAERHTPSRSQLAAGDAVSQWAVLARAPGRLGRVVGDPRWHRCRSNRATAWSDDYSNLLGAVQWG